MSSRGLALLRGTEAAERKGSDVARSIGGKTQASRARIVSAAARLLRERGFDGIGVDELMQSAGMTHGGFYRHFQSKDDLIVESCRQAFAQTREGLAGVLASEPDAPLKALVARYLSADHRDDPGAGCSLTTLAADAARRGNPALRLVFTDAVRTYVDAIATLVPADSPEAKRQAAFATLAEMVGAVVLARVVADDRELADEMIDRVRDDLSVRLEARGPGDDRSPDADRSVHLAPDRPSTADESQRTMNDSIREGTP